MQMKLKYCGLFRTTPEISNTDLQSPLIVHLMKVESMQNGHVRPVPQVKCFNKQFVSIPYCCTLCTNNSCKISDMSRER